MLVITAAAIACIPNRTSENFFCNGGAANVYAEDDLRSVYDADCNQLPTTYAEVSVKITATERVPLPSRIRGPLCACDYASTSPDPLIRDRTQFVKCAPDASASPLEDMLAFENNLKQFTTPVVPSCPQTLPRCVGFFSKAYIRGVLTPLPGVCQPMLLGQPNYSSPDFVHPVFESRARERNEINSEPCNCFNKPPVWRIERSTKDVLARVLDTAESTTCAPIRAGYGWKDEKLILTMPLGPPTEVSVVRKTGTLVNNQPCGIKNTHPPGSITLKDYCSVPPESNGLLSLLTYEKAYRPESAAVIYGIRNLCSASKRNDKLNINLAPGSLFDALKDDEARTAKLVLILLAEELEQNTRAKLEAHPPRWHGSEGFPSSVNVHDHDFHIGSPSFPKTIVDPDGTVSPFRLLFYHFSTAVVDYGALMNNRWTWKEEHFRPSGSHLGKRQTFDPSYLSGFAHRFLGDLPSLLNKLTLPAKVANTSDFDCHHPLREKQCAIWNANESSDPRLGLICDYEAPVAGITVEEACYIRTELRATQLTLQSLFSVRNNNPWPSRLLSLPGVGPQTSTLDPAECYSFFEHTAEFKAFYEAAHPFKKRAIGMAHCAAIIDLVGQFWQIIKLALPSVLTESYFDSLFADGEGVCEMFTDDIYTTVGITDHLKTNMTVVGADPDLNKDMFVATDVEVWNSLCTELVRPVSAVFVADGCTEYPKSTIPFDTSDPKTDPCAVLTMIPYGLTPSKGFNPTLEPQQLSEAAAMAAWPHLDPLSYQNPKECFDAIKHHRVANLTLLTTNDVECFTIEACYQAFRDQCDVFPRGHRLAIQDLFSYDDRRFALIDCNTKSFVTLSFAQTETPVWNMIDNQILSLCLRLDGFTRSSYAIPPTSTAKHFTIHELGDEIAKVATHYANYLKVLKHEHKLTNIAKEPLSVKDVLEGSLPYLRSDAVTSFFARKSIELEGKLYTCGESPRAPDRSRLINPANMTIEVADAIASKSNPRMFMTSAEIVANGDNKLGCLRSEDAPWLSETPLAVYVFGMTPFLGYDDRFDPNNAPGKGMRLDGLYDLFYPFDGGINEILDRSDVTGLEDFLAEIDQMQPETVPSREVEKITEYFVPKDMCPFDLIGSDTDSLYWKPEDNNDVPAEFLNNFVPGVGTRKNFNFTYKQVLKRYQLAYFPFGTNAAEIGDNPKPLYVDYKHGERIAKQTRFRDQKFLINDRVSNIFRACTCINPDLELDFATLHLSWFYHLGYGCPDKKLGRTEVAYVLLDPNFFVAMFGEQNWVVQYQLGMKLAINLFSALEIEHSDWSLIGLKTDLHHFEPNGKTVLENRKSKFRSPPFSTLDFDTENINNEPVDLRALKSWNSWLTYVDFKSNQFKVSIKDSLLNLRAVPQPLAGAGVYPGSWLFDPMSKQFKYASSPRELIVVTEGDNLNYDKGDELSAYRDTDTVANISMRPAERSFTLRLSSISHEFELVHRTIAAGTADCFNRVAKKDGFIDSQDDLNQMNFHPDIVTLCWPWIDNPPPFKDATDYPEKQNDYQPKWHSAPPGSHERPVHFKQSDKEETPRRTWYDLYGEAGIVALTRLGYMAAGRAAPHAITAFMVSDVAMPVATCAELSNAYVNYGERVVPNYQKTSNSRLLNVSDTARVAGNRVKCKEGVRCAPLNDNRIVYSDPVTGQKYGATPHLKRQFKGPMAFKVNLDSGQANQISPALFLRPDVWYKFEDYSTLRADTTWGLNVGFNKHVLRSNPDVDWRPGIGERFPAERFNKFMASEGIRRDAIMFETANRVLRRSPDAVTQSGGCFPHYHTVLDQDTPSLYRRRHFVKLTDQILNAKVSILDPVGNPFGELPLFVGTHEEVESLRDGFKSQSMNRPGYMFNFHTDVVPPPPPSPACHGIECFFDGMVAVADTAIDIAEKAVVPAVVGFALGGPVGAAIGFTAGASLATYNEITEMSDDPCKEYDPSTSIDSAASDAFWDTYGTSKASCDKASNHIDTLSKTTGLDEQGRIIRDRGFADDELPPPELQNRLVVWNRTMPPFLFTPDEWKLHEALTKLSNKPNSRSVNVAIAGNKLFVTPNDADAPVNDILERYADFRFESENVYSIAGEPDGVPYFTAATIPFPSVWRVVTTTEHVERPGQNNPYDTTEFKYKLTADSIAEFCGRESDSPCDANHRACIRNNTECVPRDVPNCADDGFPCSDPEFPVCVAVKRTPLEGIPLSEDGTRRLAVINDDPVCIPLAHKKLLTAATKDALFDDFVLRRSNCPFATSKRIDCLTPPQNLTEVALDTSFAQTSKWASFFKPYSYFSTASAPPNEVTFTKAGPASRDTTAEEVLAFVDDVEVGNGYPITSNAFSTGGPSCGPGGVDCAFLVDYVTDPPCPSYSAGSWAGTCIKPQLQLTTPANFSRVGYLQAAYATTRANRDDLCPVYEPELQITGEASHIGFSDEIHSNPELRLSAAENDLNPVGLQAVHYCDTAATKLYFCDNDALTAADRLDLCASGGKLAYEGVKLINYDLADVCNFDTKVCHLLPNVPNMGSLRQLVTAIEALDDPSDFTIKVLPFTYAAVESLLLGALVYDVSVINAIHPFTACGGGCGQTDNLFCTAAQLAALGDKIVSSQALPNGGLNLARALCSSTFDANVLSTFEQISARSYTSVLNNAVSVPPEAFTPLIDEGGVIVVKANGLTIEPVSGTLNITQLSFRVLASGFTMRNAVLSTATSPAISFSGATATDTTLENIEATNASLTVAFVGAATDYAAYSPAIDVSKTELLNVTGSYSAGFARAVGTITIETSMAVLTPPTKRCNLWSSAYGEAIRYPHDVHWELVDNQFVGTGTAYNATFALNGEVALYGTSLINTKRRQCVHIKNGRLQLDKCPGTAFTPDFHEVGNPFLCIVPHDGAFIHTPCSPCTVGHGRHTVCDSGEPLTRYTPPSLFCENNTVCTKCGLSQIECTTDRPTGYQILGCAPNPHGAVYDFKGCPPGNTITMEGAVGAVVDCDTNKVLVGGYGYRGTANVTTHRVLIQPESSVANFEIVDQTTEVINITEYTAIFGKAYEEALYHTGPSLTPVKAFGITVLLMVIAIEAILHIGLTWNESVRQESINKIKTARKSIFASKDKRKEE